MKIKLQELTLTFKQAVEHLELRHVSFFSGKMAAGKSTIVRLLDYCLGGNLTLTPALQSEFVSATLSLTILDSPLTLTRHRDSHQIEAAWTSADGPFHAMVPARKPAGEVLPGTGVAVLSDLLFFIAGIRAPRVRKSRLREDSELERLSFRDLLWYCYLDQDTIDSDFFHLEKGADHFKQLKSRHVLRFLLGYHQERVTELEADVEEARQRRFRAEEGARALQEALKTAGLLSADEIAVREAHLQSRMEILERDIKASRDAVSGERQHALERLRDRGRTLGAELQAVEEAVRDVERLIGNDRRHKNELITLSMKFRRAADARAVLNQVEFTACPRCTQRLAAPDPGCCPLCRQPDREPSPVAEETMDADLSARIAEIEDLIERHTRQLGVLHRDRQELAEEKSRLDRELNESSRQYDSSYLSSALQFERERATTAQQLVELGRFKALDGQRKSLAKQAAEAEVASATLRRELGDARKAAESDTRNLRRLAELFLDCLLRARLPGFSAKDSVTITGSNFLPEVSSPGAEDVVTTSFGHLGSGGKKTLFKCCFAVALHRLAAETGAVLPSLLIIDTAMKNISERENRDQFEGFYSMLYQLAVSELRDTQFVIVDKEFFSPPDGVEVDRLHRVMTPDDLEAPPLISYYRGH